MTDGGDVARESRPLAGVRTDDLWPVFSKQQLANSPDLMDAGEVNDECSDTSRTDNARAA